ncbi:hypothetical protein G6514_000249 [Epicoccum nigrum]|nr:hypothetical protein G6514_000249 [Epicoccum nigrum]
MRLLLRKKLATDPPPGLRIQHVAIEKPDTKPTELVHRYFTEKKTAEHIAQKEKHQRLQRRKLALEKYLVEKEKQQQTQEKQQQTQEKQQQTQEKQQQTQKKQQTQEKKQTQKVQTRKVHWRKVQTQKDQTEKDQTEKDQTEKDRTEKNQTQKDQTQKARQLGDSVESMKELRKKLQTVQEQLAQLQQKLDQANKVAEQPSGDEPRNTRPPRSASPDEKSPDTKSLSLESHSTELSSAQEPARAETGREAAETTDAANANKSEHTADPAITAETISLAKTAEVARARKTEDRAETKPLMDELFPGASNLPSLDNVDRPSPPKLDLPAPDRAVPVRVTLSDGRTDREKAIDAFRAHGEQITVLQLSHCSTALTEADFRRVSPRGLHIETWSRDGEFYKIIPGRDPLSLARLPFYYLLFRTPESALAYQKNASRLSRLTALHQASDMNSAVPLPKGFLEEGEDINAVTSSFVLHPRGQTLDLRTIMQPYQRALRALIDAGGYSPIVPNVDDKGKKIHRVLLHIDGYEPSHWDLWQILARHAHARGLMWPFRNDSAGLRKLRDCINLKTNSRLQAASQMNPWAANSSSPQLDVDYEDVQISSFLGLENGEQQEAGEAKRMNQLVMHRVYNRWIVEMEDEDAARRFAQLWHRVVLPFAKDGRDGAWKEVEEERWVEAEYLW